MRATTQAGVERNRKSVGFSIISGVVWGLQLNRDGDNAENEVASERGLFSVLQSGFINHDLEWSTTSDDRVGALDFISFMSLKAQ